MEVARPVRRAGRGNPPTEKQERSPRSDPYTEHPTREGRVYCAVVLDVFSRRVVGWSIDNSATAGLVTSALGMAISNRQPDPGTVIHSDQGTQFASWAFTQRAHDSGLVPSMGTVGDCFDNALMEAFWARMQVELLDRKRWRTRIELANAIFEYLEIFHNRRRRLHRPSRAHPHRIRKHPLQQPNRRTADPSELTPQNRVTITGAIDSRFGNGSSEGVA